MRIHRRYAPLLRGGGKGGVSPTVIQDLQRGQRQRETTRPATIGWSDGTTTRTRIGRHTTTEYGLRVWDSAGVLDHDFTGKTPQARGVSASASLASGTTPVVRTLGTITYDTDTFYTASPSSRFVVPSGMGGLYMVTAQMVFAAAGGGNVRACVILVDGTYEFENRAVGQAGGFPTARETRVSTSGLVSLAAAQYVQLAAEQDSGGALNVSGHIEIARVGSLPS